MSQKYEPKLFLKKKTKPKNNQNKQNKKNPQKPHTFFSFCA